MGIPAGHFDFEAIRKALDEQGLDSPGKSLRDAARKAQAIDRDLPDNTGIDDHIADAFGGVDYGKLIREADAQRDAIKKAMGMNPKWAKCPDLYSYQKIGKDAFKKAYGGVVTGPHPRQTNAELQQEYFDAKARGDTGTQDYIRAKLARRMQKGDNV